MGRKADKQAPVPSTRTAAQRFSLVLRRFLYAVAEGLGTMGELCTGDAVVFYVPGSGDAVALYGDRSVRDADSDELWREFERLPRCLN
jgi:hypothetical protein